VLQASSTELLSMFRCCSFDSAHAPACVVHSGRAPACGAPWPRLQRPLYPCPLPLPEPASALLPLFALRPVNPGLICAEPTPPPLWTTFT
jgi:hypothetical protein